MHSVLKMSLDYAIEVGCKLVEGNPTVHRRPTVHSRSVARVVDPCHLYADLYDNELDDIASACGSSTMARRPSVIGWPDEICLCRTDCENLARNYAPGLQ